MEDLIKLIILYVFGISSLICLLFIIISFIIQKSLRTYSFMRIFHLSFTTFISTASYFIPNKTFCIYQGFLMILFDLSQFTWSLLINNSVYRYIIHFDSNNSDTIFVETISGEILFGYIFPFAYSVLFYILGFIGESGDYCWIKEEHKYPFLVTHSIVWSIILGNIIYAFAVISYISKLRKEDKEIVKNFHMKLLLYPIIQITLTIPGSICRILLFMTEFAQKEPLKYILELISLTLFLSSGSCLLIAFRGNIEWIFNLRCCKKRKNKPIETKKKIFDKIPSNELSFNIDIDSSIFVDN